MAKVMIVDDHALIRRVVRQIIEKESDLEIIAEAANGFEAEVQAAQTQPDVVLMDLDMPNCDGFEATRRVIACSPHSRIVIFTASRQEQHAFRAIQHGAIGYITKDIDPEALVSAIRSAARDELCLPRSLATQLLAQIRSLGQHNVPSPSLAAPIAYQIPQHLSEHTRQEEGKARTLTEREREILNLMRLGHKNREIAQELSIAESTVHKHIQNIFEKLHARNRTEAIYLTTTTIA
ncbi:MAG: response regulator [Ktedonobacteraceae bacterium]|jgi:two-component system, NarL family, nitrate/nitrite response regulator NarL